MVAVSLKNTCKNRRRYSRERAHLILINFGSLQLFNFDRALASYCQERVTVSAALAASKCCTMYCKYSNPQPREFVRELVVPHVFDAHAQPILRPKGHLGDLYAESGQTWKGSFSCVSTPNFASKYASESSRRDLHNALICTVLNAQKFLQKIAEFLPNFRQSLLNYLTNFR